MQWGAAWTDTTSFMPMQVFDGHSGETAARFAEQHLLPNLLKEETFLTAPAEALVRLSSLTCLPTRHKSAVVTQSIY